MGRKRIYCMAPKCSRLVYARGLCGGHVSQLHRLVKQGRIKMADAVRTGKILPTRLRNKPSVFIRWVLGGGKYHAS